MGKIVDQLRNKTYGGHENELPYHRNISAYVPCHSSFIPLRRNVGMLLFLYGNACFSTTYAGGFVQRAKYTMHETSCLSIHCTVAILQYIVRMMGLYERPATNARTRMPKDSETLRPKIAGNSATHSGGGTKSATPSFCVHRGLFSARSYQTTSPRNSVQSRESKGKSRTRCNQPLVFTKLYGQSSSRHSEG